MRTRTSRYIGLLATLAVLATACTTSTSTNRDANPSTTRAISTRPESRPVGVPAANALIPFDACDTFLDYVTSQAVDLVGPHGLDDPFSYPWWGGDDVFFEEAAASGADASFVGQARVNYSETNVQVLGVDEPDMVKTDGERILVLSEGTLIVTDITGAEPEVIGRLQVGNFSVQSLFLSGDTVLLFGSDWSSFHPLIEGDAEFSPVYETPTIRLIEVDISGEPGIVRTMRIDGRYLSARMIDDTVRLILSSGPVGFEWSYPGGSGLRAERKAIEENRQIIENSTADNWIPYYVITDADGDVTAEGTLFDCDRANHPQEFAGINMLSVATIDLGSGLDVVDATGVLATGNTIYASADNLYVATQNWDAFQWAQTGEGTVQPDGVTTEIHKFDISRSDVTSYVASGRVVGYLLNQFAMDEHEGLLRVASTTSPAGWSDSFDSESLLTVLEEDDGELVEIGRVDGLGETEQIYSVRFMGDIAYVVTFRQTDPLYTVDLSNPRQPKVVGELKILGYSAYLHPLGDGLLMGVGQDATDTGRLQGTQVSIFDVSDPSDPIRIDQITLDKGSSSEIEYDHHAFLYWEPSGLVMVPVQQWWWDETSESAFFGAIGLAVDDDGKLREVRRIAHPGGDDDSWDYRAAIMRSVVIGDDVYTVSAKGILKSDLDTLTEVAWLGF